MFSLLTQIDTVALIAMGAAVVATPFILYDALSNRKAVSKQ